jgi:hypothetical protein
MHYTFAKHYSLANPPPANWRGGPTLPRVLLAEPEAESLAVYARHLDNAKLTVSVCLDLSNLVRHIRETDPHLLIVNPSSDLSLGIRMLEQAAVHFPDLPVITVGAAIPEIYLDRLMGNTGVTLHLNRALSQPSDVAVAAQHLLNHY